MNGFAANAAMTTYTVGLAGYFVWDLLFRIPNGSCKKEGRGLSVRIPSSSRDDAVVRFVSRTFPVAVPASVHVCSTSRERSVLRGEIRCPETPPV